MSEYLATTWPYLLIGATWGVLSDSLWKVVAGSLACAFLAKCAAAI